MTDLKLKLDPAKELLAALQITILPNGNKTINIKRALRKDRIVLLCAENYGVPEFKIPEQK
jgi:hypothetical protein